LIQPADTLFIQWLTKANALFLRCVSFEAHAGLSYRISSLPGERQKRQNPADVKDWQATLAILVSLAASLALTEDFKMIDGSF
jgi:hypothetical protein